jgi:nitroreductase
MNDTATNPAFRALMGRHSTPSKLLGEPGPTDEQLAQLLALAVHVPDHGKLAPWRFVRIAGEARAAFGERLVAIQRSRGVEDQATLDKDRQRFGFAPVIVAVVARITPGHKIPEQEQLLSAGNAAFHLLHGAHALGYGAQWLTGWMAYDAEVGRMFELAAGERIIAFVHIGTPREPMPDRPRPDPTTLVSDLIFPPV